MAVSTACRLPDNTANPLLARSRSELEEAKVLFDALEVKDNATRLDLLTGSYPWLGRTGNYRGAASAAADAAQAARAIYGGHHPRTDMAMHDVAFYTRRFDPAGGVRAYRELLDERVQRWGDSTHPVVAVQMKDLAAALLGIGDEASAAEAVSLAQSAYASLLRSSGPEDSRTAAAESVLALALVRQVPYLSETEAIPVRKMALERAENALAMRKLARPAGSHLPQRSTLAFARLANGDLTGFEELEVILALREQIYDEPHSVAEIRWQATRMAEAYTRMGKVGRATELIEKYRLDGADAVIRQP